MSLASQVTELQMRILALLACRQSVKYTAKCLGLSPRQVHYYHSTLRVKWSLPDQQGLIDFIHEHEDYDALNLMGQHLMVAYEMGTVQRRLAMSQQD